MFDTTLDLFAYNDQLDDKQHMIDTMAEVYFDAMVRNVEENDNVGNATACHDEFIVDGVDPQDGGVNFIFAPDITRSREE